MFSGVLWYLISTKCRAESGKIETTMTLLLAVFLPLINKMIINYDHHDGYDVVNAEAVT